MHLAPAENGKKRMTAPRWNTHWVAASPVNKLYFVNFFLIKKKVQEKEVRVQVFLSTEVEKGKEERLAWPWAWEPRLGLCVFKHSLCLASLYLLLVEKEKPLCALALAGSAVL